MRAKDRALSHDVRTIVVRESGKRGKERWHGLWIFHDDDTPAYDLVQEFRTRQHHEQTYRIMLHDIYVDTAPSGYSKHSPNPQRPGFKQNALTLYGWVAALADLYLGDGTLIVCLKPRRLHSLWRALLSMTNRRNTRIPWLENRRLILSLDQPPAPGDPEISLDPHR